jgi:hypothetical protein
MKGKGRREGKGRGGRKSRKGGGRGEGKRGEGGGGRGKILWRKWMIPILLSNSKPFVPPIPPASPPSFCPLYQHLSTAFSFRLPPRRFPEGLWNSGSPGKQAKKSSKSELKGTGKASNFRETVLSGRREKKVPWSRSGW